MKTSGSRRFTNSASGKTSDIHVDLPVPRGPKRKKLSSLLVKIRLIISILRLNMEILCPIFDLMSSHHCVFYYSCKRECYFSNLIFFRSAMKRGSERRGSQGGSALIQGIRKLFCS